MYVMYRVGIATAIGLVIEVPILLRSLADSLAEVDIRHLPLGFHPSLLAALDDGVAADGPARLVGSYACDWWRQRRNRPQPRFLAWTPWRSASSTIGNTSLPLLTRQRLGSHHTTLQMPLAHHASRCGPWFTTCSMNHEAQRSS